MLKNEGGERQLWLGLRFFSWVTFSISTSLPLYKRVSPADLSDANKRNSFTGKDLSSRILIISMPTAPLAPSTATVKERSGRNE